MLHQKRPRSRKAFGVFSFFSYMTFYMTFSKRKSPEGKSCEALGVFSTEYNQNNVLTYLIVIFAPLSASLKSAALSVVISMLSVTVSTLLSSLTGASCFGCSYSQPS